MLQSLSVRNFRGLRQFDAANFGRVNVFIGTNAAGKTSVLEAISIAANPATPAWLLTLSGWREMQPASFNNDDALRAYFYDLDISQTPRICFTDDGAEHELVIAPLSAKRVSQTVAESSSADAGSLSSEGRTELRGISLSLTPPNGQPVVKSTLELQERGGRVESAKYAEKFGCFYIHARRANSAGETATLLTSLFEKKQEADFLEVMQLVDKRVVKMWPGVRPSGPTVLVDIGLPHMLPINLLGDGICRVALMATGLLSGQSKILIVDEIDSGLHFSVMPSVWRGISKLAQQKQVFCATHSEEMLSAAMEAFAETPQDLRFFRIDRLENDRVRATPLDYTTVEASRRAGLEIR